MLLKSDLRMSFFLQRMSAVLVCVLGIHSALWARSPVLQSGVSGIEAIDTLPVYEWDVDTENRSLTKALLWGLAVPGGAQFYQEHYTRGGFLLAIEGALLFEVAYNKPMQQRERIKEIHHYQDSVGFYDRLLMSTGVVEDHWIEQRYTYLNLIRRTNDMKMKEEDLRNSEIAWLVGLHLYGLLDGYGIWRHNQGRSTEKREVIDAVWRAALVPGWGQIYNEDWGKAGLLYMAIVGGSVSWYSRHQMVEYFTDRLKVAEAEEQKTLSAEIEEDLLFFRKKRNQYIWGLALFYLYSIADAAVDAALSDFESPAYWAVFPNVHGLGFGIEAGFSF